MDFNDLEKGRGVLDIDAQKLDKEVYWIVSSNKVVRTYQCSHFQQLTLETPYLSSTF